MIYKTEPSIVTIINEGGFNKFERKVSKAISLVLLNFHCGINYFLQKRLSEMRGGFDLLHFIGDSSRNLWFAGFDFLEK